MHSVYFVLEVSCSLHLNAGKLEMKKENDIMRYNLQFAMNGGDLQKMEGKEKLKAFLDMTPDVTDAF